MTAKLEWNEVLQKEKKRTADLYTRGKLPEVEYLARNSFYSRMQNAGTALRLQDGLRVWLKNERADARLALLRALAVLDTIDELAVVLADLER